MHIMIPRSLKPGVYRLARRFRPVLPYGVLANLAQWATRYAHEPDFEVFDWMTGIEARVLDVGASRGQSALSILRRTQRTRVFSIEPNLKHRWSLILIRLLHPFRFRFRMVASGNEFAHQTLFVPGRRASGLSAQGSLDPAEFEKDYIKERLLDSGFDPGDVNAYRKLKVRVVPLDSLGLSPDLIKMDVEGFEQQALKGLEVTLAKHHPALLIEINNPKRWMPVLDSLGYEFYYYDEADKLLRHFDEDWEALNVFCLHKNNRSDLTRVLLEHVETR